MSQNANQEELEFWPAWKGEDHDLGLASIARYVSTKSLEGRTGLLMPDAQRGADISLLAEGCYELLKDYGFAYRAESPLPRAQGHQDIHHLDWAASDGANCLDLSLIYAAQCLCADISPLIAIIEGHAFVLVADVRNTRERSRPLQLEGIDQVDGEYAGTLVARAGALEAALGRGELIAVDCEQAARGADFADACERGAGFAGARDLRLFDIACLQSNDRFAAPDPPRDWRAQQRFPAETWEAPGLKAQQQEVLDKITAAGSGKSGFVIHAPQGRGKSTVGRAIIGPKLTERGWFLDASDVKSLATDLARAELLERGEQMDVMSEADRDAYAQSALLRLQETKRPWKVVLDNAGERAKDLMKLACVPHAPNQLLVVTTIHDKEWGDVGLSPLLLKAIDSSSDAWKTHSDEISALIDGRALMLAAFETLVADFCIEPAAITEAASAEEIVRLADELRGPATLWFLLRGLSEDDSIARAGLVASTLPPDHIDQVVLTGLTDASAVEKLMQARLLQPRGDELTLHRLFATAIREFECAVNGRELLAETVVHVASDGGARELFESFGTREELGMIASDIQRHWTFSVDEERLRLVPVVSATAAISEFRGNANASYMLYDLVRELLDGRQSLSQSESRSVADAFLSAAREANRMREPTADDLTAGIEHARRGRELSIAANGEGRSGRFFAMEGLLFKKLARKGDPAAELERLAEAQQMLEHADELRRDDPETSEREKLLSLFNLAGIGIHWAQVDRGSADEHLRSADAVYKEVAERRSELYRTPIHSHIATCHQGRAYVSFYRAMLVTCDGESRFDALAESAAHIETAMAQWNAIGNRSEIAKANGFIAKLAMARSFEQFLGDESSVALDSRIDGMVRTIKDELSWAENV